MRHRHAYLVTLILDEDEPAVLRGRLRHVASAVEMSFLGDEQLLSLLRDHSGASAGWGEGPGQTRDEASGPHPPI